MQFVVSGDVVSPDASECQQQRDQPSTVPTGAAVHDAARCCTSDGGNGGSTRVATSLRPVEIISDTAGYSDLIFGLFWVLGYQFSPRLIDIGGAASGGRN